MSVDREDKPGFKPVDGAQWQLGEPRGRRTRLSGPNGTSEKRGKLKKAAQQKYQAIYQATLEVCQTKGIGNATTAEIARAANIAAGTLFCYHASKKELLNAVYQNIISNLSEYAERELEQVPNYNKERQLRRLWQCHVEWYKSHSLESSFLGMAISPNGEKSPYITEETLEELLPCYGYAKKIVQSAVDQGVLRPLPPMLLLRIFIANSMTVASLYLSKGSVSAFLRETPQLLCELEDAAWQMIASPAIKPTG